MLYATCQEWKDEEPRTLVPNSNKSLLSGFLLNKYEPHKTLDMEVKKHITQLPVVDTSFRQK